MTELIEDFPHICHDEMADFIAEEFSVSVSQSTISRILEYEGISQKKVLLTLNI